MKTCIATGGGIVTEAKNWGRMQTGVVVWLDMEVRDVPAIFFSTPRTDHDLDNIDHIDHRDHIDCIDPMYAVMVCCAGSVWYRSNPGNVCY